MKANVGTTDKIIRILIAVAIVIQYTIESISGIFGIVLLIIAGILVLTSVIGFCPIYRLFNFNSCPTKQKGMH